MNLRTRALIGAGVTGLALSLTSAFGSEIQTNGFLLAVITLIVGVASTAQVMTHRADEKHVYKPVYVRSAKVQRRVKFDD